MGLLSKLKSAFSKKNDANYEKALTNSRSFLSSKLNQLASKYREVNQDFIDELTEILIMSDISIKTVDEVVLKVTKKLKEANVFDQNMVKEIVIDEIFINYVNQKSVNSKLNIEPNRLNVILVVGVNGSGKTTSIAKLANKLKAEGYKVVLSASDTFRAAATEQLDIWANRVGVDCIKSDVDNADPASVIYKAIDHAIQVKADVLICDSAGRLQNKINLMNELAKICKVIQKKIPDAPHEVLLTIDATTGQNGISQAKIFGEVAKVTGIILTKIDGTSKGGIILTINNELNIPVKLIGLGEKLDNLNTFDLEQYIYNLVKDL